MIHETPAERRRKAHEARILDAALAIVGESGIDGLSIKAIAERADYSAGALYRYFASKDELVAALALRVLDALGAELGACSTKHPLARVSELAHRFVDFAFEDESRYGLLNVLLADPRVLVGDPALAGRVFAAVVRVLAPLVESFEQAACEKILPEGDARTRALLFASSLLGLLLLRKQAARFPRELALDVLEVELVTTLLRGFGAKEKVLFRIEGRSRR